MRESQLQSILAATDSKELCPRAIAVTKAHSALPKEVDDEGESSPYCDACMPMYQETVLAYIDSNSDKEIDDEGASAPRTIKVEKGENKQSTTIDFGMIAACAAGLTLWVSNY
uniref:Uncharacterized protein n=1 Tax=Trieres chinensis TaxID=1514140 RepID=A0A7S2ED68_TRICV|mmetsp:Transcript_18665/g.37847  ORF Transcript_18665/g.37847 Transcript_18665/m.37847 type:complete len:113 (+) Transcript_18665:173-511(+)